MIRVLIVDDHPVVRAGLVALLATQEGLDVVGEAASHPEAVVAVHNLRPDVVLMDLQLGSSDGVSATREILTAHPEVKVLILTTFDTDADIVAAIEAGAVGYLLKDASPVSLTEAVHAAAKGQTVLAPAVAGKLARRVTTPDSALTAREQDVIRLLADGLSNRQISRALFLSEATVKTHLVHIFDKLHVDNRTAAVAAARRLGHLR